MGFLIQLYGNVDFYCVSAAYNCISSRHAEKAWLEPCFTVWYKVNIYPLLQNKAQELDFVDSPVELPRIPKNEAPSRFWATVEPYCSDITNEDLKVLEEILRSHEDDADYYKSPSLGKHFSQKWAQEDILEEQREGKKLRFILNHRIDSSIIIISYNC